MNYKEACQEMTELNADGNRNRGREGEELVSYSRTAPAHHDYVSVTEDEWKNVVSALNNLESERGQDGVLELNELEYSQPRPPREVKITLPVRTRVGVKIGAAE